MRAQETPGGAGNLLLSLAAFVVVVAGMKASTDLLVPVLMALFVTIICAQPMQWLRNRKVPTWAALVIMLLVVALLGALLVGMISDSAAKFSEQLPAYQQRLESLLERLTAWTGSLGLGLPQGGIVSKLDAGSLTKIFASMLGGLTQMATNALFVLLTVVFMLLESVGFRQKMARAMGGSGRALEGLDDAVARIQRYMALKTLMSLVTGVALGVWLHLVGLDYAVLWAVIAFLFNFVPNIGSIIAAVPAILLAMLQLGPAAAAWSAAGFLVVNFVVGNVLEPRIMGRGVGLSTLVVFLSLVFWGWVLGVVGMLLSVPLTIAVRIALEANPQTRWLAVVLGPTAEPTPGTGD